VLKKMYVLRRILNPMGTMDAIDFLLDKLRNTKNNSESSTPRARTVLHRRAAAFRREAAQRLIEGKRSAIAAG